MIKEQGPMKVESNIKVTVIVPVHNSEKYLKGCLESALSQTFREIEILCIDTGNTDRCFKIISALQAQDDRIAYIRDPNSSYGHKINVGIGAAKGEYAAILETDDRMSQDMLEKLYSAAKKYDADIVNSDYFEFFEYKGRRLFEKCEIYQNFAVCDRLINYTVETPKTTVAEGIWTALYRKDFLLTQKIRLNESPGASYQDASFLFLRGLLAKSVYHLDEPLYWYRIDNAGSSVKDDKKIFEMADEYNFLKQELKKRNVTDDDVWNLFYFRKYKSFHWNYGRLSEKARERFLERYLDEIRADIASNAISRTNCDEDFYNRTFLLVDDLARFKELAAEADCHKPVQAIVETLGRLEDREVVVFGAGVLGTRIVSILQQNENQIVGICDNAGKLHGTVLYGLEVRPVAETIKRFPDACYLVVNRKHSDEMKAQLVEEGIGEANIEMFK